MDKFGDEIRYEVLDAGFKTPAICRMIIEDNKIPLLPYTRPKGSKDMISKKEFRYNEEEDYYVCPNNEILKYSTVTKEGYKIYKSDIDKCKNCPLKEQCTKSKINQKTISRHVWAEYVEYTNEIRYTEDWKENYPLRKQTVERIFGDCKENMCLRFTREKGLEKNRNNASMIFTCHNLKKMAIWRWKYKEKKTNIKQLFYKILKILNFYKQKLICSFKHINLSTV